MLELDYSFLKADAGTAEACADDLDTTLSLWDESTQLAVSVALAGEKTEIEYFVAASMIQFIDGVGYRRVRIRTDGEPVISVVARS